MADRKWEAIPDDRASIRKKKKKRAAPGISCVYIHIKLLAAITEEE